MNKEATIHFTEDGGAYIFTGDDPDAGFITTHPSHITNTRADLEKMRLEAVIQKEAEEKYPERNVSFLRRGKGIERKDANKYNRDLYIDFWQSLLSRLPSEEEIEKEAKSDLYLYNSHDTAKYYSKINGANWLKSKLLPSLPSSLMCEYSEENGKIEVKKIWV